MEAEEDVAPPGMETDAEVKKGKTYTYDYIVYYVKCWHNHAQNDQSL